jgi:hypothetical protein
VASDSVDNVQDLAWSEDQGSSSGSTSGQDDAYYEKMRVGVREVRAWVRGRYAHVAPSSIDEVSSWSVSPIVFDELICCCRFYGCFRRVWPVGQLDTLSGGQFFAALRLVVHIESGMDLDRGLAFLQGTLHYLQYELYS